MSYSWQFELECAGRDARNRVMGLLSEDSRKNAAGVRCGCFGHYARECVNSGKAAKA